MNDETTTYGDLIRQARTEKRLTQRELAGLLGCTDGFITKVEKGIMIPSTDFLARLALALELSDVERTHLADAVVEARRTLSNERHEKREESIRSTLRPAPSPTGELPPLPPVPTIAELVTELSRHPDSLTPEFLELVRKLQRAYQDPQKRKAIQVALTMVEST